MCLVSLQKHYHYAIHLQVINVTKKLINKIPLNFDTYSNKIYKRYSKLSTYNALCLKPYLF